MGSLRLGISLARVVYFEIYIAVVLLFLCKHFLPHRRGSVDALVVNASIAAAALNQTFSWANRTETTLSPLALDSFNGTTMTPWTVAVCRPSCVYARGVCGH
ncbi:Aste57867_14276 [Aphanomyces stellatus]|uniref:Aste57867_14276 protein n=1 Tax=Aphanomyces stellatus TaxID=120398 RepID=A0A485L0J9_9STRA|nr:hypothetical protein As57867_014224 [Aphanomyces stellatus]VFT91101.1 Aste57867_14276 [Aphanomyces stellatus]